MDQSFAPFFEALKAYSSALGLGGEEKPHNDWAAAPELLNQMKALLPRSCLPALDSLDRLRESMPTEGRATVKDLLAFSANLQAFINRLQSAVLATEEGQIAAKVGEFEGLSDAILQFGQTDSEACDAITSEVARVPAVKEAASNILVAAGKKPVSSAKLLAQTSAAGRDLLGGTKLADMLPMLSALNRDVQDRYAALWVDLQTDAGIPRRAADMYAAGWNELLPGSRVLTADTIAVIARECEDKARANGLSESADFLADPGRFSNYALQNLMPRISQHWKLESPAALERILKAQIGLWYFRPFGEPVTPVSMASAVLRTGRPLYYERVVANAMCQFRIIEPAMRTSPDYFRCVEILLDDFRRLTDGYILRTRWISRLKRPSGWRSYLEELIGVHFGQASEELSTYRRAFLKSRGLQDACEVLRAPGAPAQTVQ